METAFKRDDLVGAIAMPCPEFARELDRALIRLRAGIGEENLIEAAVIHQRFCQLKAGPVVESWTGRQQHLGLSRQRFGYRRRGMAKTIDRPTLDEVEVAPAAVIPQK